MMPPIGYYVRESVKWLAVGTCVFYAVHITNSPSPLWFFLIPAIWSASWVNGKDDE